MRMAKVNDEATLENVLERGAPEEIEAAFLSDEISLRFPPETLLLPITEVLPPGTEHAGPPPKPTKKTNRNGCCD
jgi:hypothetical protein